MAYVSSSAGYVGLLTTWLNRRFVSDLEWELQFQKFTTKAIIPPGSGKIGRFNVFAEPPAGTSYSTSSTTALTEALAFATTNQINTITAASTDVTVTEYGEYYRTSTLMEYAAMPGSREKLRKRLRDGAAITIDTLVKAQYQTSTNYAYADATADGLATTWNTGTVGIVGAATIIGARKILYAAKCTGFEGIPGHPNKQFAAILSPKGELDVVTEVTTGRVYWSTAVVNVPGKMGQEKFVNGYIGSIYGTAVYCTQNFDTAQTYSVSSTGDINYIIADGAVGAVAFRDMEPQVIVNEVNSPYKNVNSVAWHVFFGVGAIDANTRVVKLYSAS